MKQSNKVRELRVPVRIIARHLKELKGIALEEDKKYSAYLDKAIQDYLDCRWYEKMKKEKE